MTQNQDEPTIDPRTIPVAPSASEDQPYIVYQGVKGMPMHREGKFYFAPRAFNITRGIFSSAFEEPELAEAAGMLWASRFENPNQMQW